MAEKAKSLKEEQMHPYWPRELVIPGYKPNDLSMHEILAGLFLMAGGLILMSWFVSSHCQKFSTARKLVLCWFTVCGFIHGVIEGWFSLFYQIIPTDQSILSQLWKEYSKGDSRYVIADNFTVCMETITALAWGPLSIWTVFAFLGNKPYRFILQLIVSLGQLYGDVLYFYTEYRDGFSHSDVGHPIYFWFYFIFMNSLWIIIPLLLIFDAWNQLNMAQKKADNRSGSLQRSKGE
ncbi:3-beta-hydroxysteroid-Delta(8),Delta(7)-isomerase [Polypterus senegalus]|uniref:3-beta-hydroxysteroid-Delta(8), Delta(7)-isomerase n=1 Tax=Polypterus senegalus TaxID=55291 RepID=UPI001966A0AE|nr:3-beta-hydroxysteroid-Delta(8),Delta(7)-isomerase [Polypterus senegalus]